MSQRLNLADGLRVPLDVVTEKLAWMGRTGSGKTYGATKLAELMLQAGAQIIALDPVGVWSGLRVGKVQLPIYVFGGLRKDFPLEATGGVLMADLIVDRGISAVLDVSQFGTDTEHRRFATDFLTRFFQRKKAAPSAVHIFLEECQEFAPQDKQHGDETMLHATQRLWKQGRNFGIGGSLISQRPQDVNKKVLEMTGTMFAFETTGPNAKKAIAGWMDAHDIDESIVDKLPTLKRGAPYVWSPTFLGAQKVIEILPKDTADVSSTPKVGGRAMVQALTPIDVERIETAMAATIEKAKAEDPRELRRQIAELRRQVKAVPAAAVSQSPAKSVPALTDADRAMLTAFTSCFAELRADLDGWHVNMVEVAKHRIGLAIAEFFEESREELEKARVELERRLDSKRFQKLIDKLQAVTATQIRPTTTVRPSPPLRWEAPTSASSRPAQRVSDGGPVKGGKYREMLIAMAQAGRPLSDTQVAARAVMALSGTFDKYLSQQRANAWVDGPRSALVITAAGLAALGAFDPLPMGVDLQAHWLRELGDGKRGEMLRVLIAAYPGSLTDSEVAEGAAMALSGTFDKYLSQLRRLQLVEGERTRLRASEELFA